MSTTKNIDFTYGSPGKKLLAFALLLFWGSLFQQLYHTADTMMAVRS